MNTNITLPSKPKKIKETQTHGIYEIDGFYPGYGHTIGNSLRRIILSSLPGSAITKVKIDGVQHEFSTIEGIKEDVITILLNLKKVRVKLLTDEPQTIKLNVKGPKVVTADDFETTGQVEIVNKDQYIAEITGKTELNMEVTLEHGLGFVPKEAFVDNNQEIGVITLDAVFSPIRRVNYEVENMRVGDRTDFNRLRIAIETDGTITPKEALEKAIFIMIEQLKAIVGFQDDEMEVNNIQDKEQEEDQQEDKEVLKTRIEELGLSTRVLNALSDASIRTLGGLVRKTESDLVSLPGLGEKGVQEIKKVLKEYNLDLLK